MTQNQKIENHEDKTHKLLDLCSILESVGRLLRNENKSALLAEWQRICQLQDSSLFTIAVVGEFSRGKSTLLNRLLEIELLPVGDLPTTSTLVHIKYGKSQTVTVTRSDGTEEILPFEPQIWDEFVATDLEETLDGVLDIQLDHDWLQQAGIQFVDTPGTGDLSSHRAVLATKAVASSDAVLVCISATMPMSLTERAFVEQHITGRKIPRVAVVVTRLDQVSSADRKKVLTHVREKLKEWEHRAELFSSHDSSILSSEEIIEVAGPADIRKRLMEWVSDPQHKQQRNLQVASQLQNLLLVYQESLQTQKEMAQFSTAEKKTAQDEAIKDMDRERLLWEDLQIAMEQKEMEITTWLEQQILEAQEDILEALCYELRKEPNPKRWLQEDLPYRFRQESTGFVKRLEHKLQERVIHTTTWFQCRLEESFRWSHKFSTTTLEVEAKYSTPGNILESSHDLEQWRTLSRIGFGAVSLASYAVLGPLAMVFGVGSGIISDKLLKSKLEQQRSLSLDALQERIPLVLQEAASMAKQKLRDIYKRILQEAKHQQKLWWTAKNEILKQGPLFEKSPEAAEMEALTAHLLQIHELLQQISVCCKSESI